jgi:hypothetical protein
MMQGRMPPCIIATRQAKLSAGLLHRRYAAVAESAETNQPTNLSPHRLTLPSQFEVQMYTSTAMRV